MTPLSPEKAAARLEQLCSRSEHCLSEVREKLLRWGVPPTKREAILDNLVKGRFVDDERFAYAFVRDKFLFSRWGRRKIAAMLSAKRIPKEYVTSAIDDVIDEDEYAEVLIGLLKSRSRSLKEPSGSREWSMKLFRFAMQRGFESDVTARAIHCLSSEDDA